jgi:CRISPR-associated protein Csx17
MTDGIRLPVVPIPGLTPDSLGNYLASLGLLHLLARKWPNVRIAWCGDVLQVAGGPTTLDDLLDNLCEIAVRRTWTLYERKWEKAQKESSELASANNATKKARSGLPFALWDSQAEESLIESFRAHVVPSIMGRSFNPTLGKAGKIGQRDFANGWSRAVKALAPPVPSKPRKTETPDKAAKRIKADEEKVQEYMKKNRVELDSLLCGKPVVWLEKDLNAACWFSNANKQYNSGQRPYRDGLLSPWAMALACEGLIFLRGGASRRLGARSHATGAFPFVTRAVAPAVAGEAGRDSGEFWAPIWGRPMALPEVTMLFQRGRAEIHGRPASTPTTFAAAVLRRGIDAGIIEFRRFVFGWTTAQDYVEPRFEGVFRLPDFTNDRTSQSSLQVTSVSASLERILGLVDRLPRDRKIGKHWRFKGLQGPVEAALLRLAAMPKDPELALGVLDAAVTSLDRVDRNRSHREARVSWQPLPIEWLPALFRDEEPTTEAGLAMALVSGFPRLRPFSLYRFGVEWKYAHFEHPDRTPPRWVWGPGALPRVLTAVLLRCTLDWESEHKKRRDGEEPVRFLMPTSSRYVSRWLDGAIDEDLLVRWLSRLALFDWRFVPREVSVLARPDIVFPEASASLCLFGLFQPLFDLRSVKLCGVNSGHDLLEPESGARTPAVARKLASLIRIGQLDTAVRFAISRYAMARASVARINTPWRVSDPERLLASVLFPIPGLERGHLVQRWLRPQRQIGETINV